MILSRLLLGALAMVYHGNLLVAANIYVPDCKKNKHKNKPVCFCRYPQNWETETCAKWWNNPKVVNNIEKVGRIVGGEEVNPKDLYPWFARLAYRNGSWRGCGGMLVAPEFVLTAAHCIGSWTANQAAVQIGAVCPEDGGDNCNEPFQQINVESISEHPSYNSQTTNNDYALLKLASRANANPVAMDQGSYVNNYSSNKRNLWAIGFGSLSSGGNVASILRHVELAYVTRNACNAQSAYGGEITNKMMCAADPGQDSCQGDSGGPLYDADNNVLVGIVSWGYGCAMPAYPGVYAQVSAEWTWIKTTICNNHSTPKPSFCSSTPTPPTAPTPTPPAPSPPTGCSGGDLTVKVTIKTDAYPTETSWTINSSDGTSNVSPLYSVSFTTYETDLCLASDSCHTFTISDVYGDGIINGDGDFSVTVNNQQVISYEGFTFSLEKEFGQCGVAPTPPTPTPPTPTPPTPTPPTPPTPTPPTPTPPTPTPPTPTPPTPTPPTITCPNGQMTVGVSVTTDDYPGETTWKVVSSNGLTENGGPYANAATTYTDDFCLPSTACHTFTIEDDFGDGILPDQGGDFSLMVNGAEKLSLPAVGFSYQMTTKFGQCDETNPCTQANRSKFKLILKTDNFGIETSFKVFRRRNNGQFTNQVFAGTNFASDTEYERSKCLPRGGCYKLVVFDSHGDGLCCDYGKGYFQGYWKGVAVPNIDAEFTGGNKSFSETFGNC